MTIHVLEKVFNLEKRLEDKQTVHLQTKLCNTTSSNPLSPASLSDLCVQHSTRIIVGALLPMFPTSTEGP